MFSIFKKLFGTANDRVVKKLFAEIDNINSLEPLMQKLTDDELKGKTAEFKQKLKNGSTLDNIVYEAFAVVREVAKRVYNTRHFDVQLIGGLILHRGMVTEMRTGEGKTLTSTLPAYLNALTERGVHVVTPNDYLASRDAHSMGKIYNFLGLSVGSIISGMNDADRRKAYNADITYATNNELGFDYLRDNMKYSIQERVQRSFNFAIIDEVDSILIDEARTPLVISGPVDDNSDLYGKIDKIVHVLTAEDYERDEKLKTINLTEKGITLIESLLVQHSIIKPESGLYDFENLSLVHYINQSLKAHHLFTIDVDYLVKDGKVMIIDEFTGRVMEGRRYSEGLHQAIEAKESVKIQNENQTLASVTFQNYFRNYPKLAGMTGTAMTESAELKDIYNLDVISVPTHNKITRIDLDDEIYGTKNDKYFAILKLIQACYERGQPVLVGTVSIEKSEEISDLLNKHKIPHKVLNAKFHAQEAFIIAQAGRYKSVTIATNMAGRGTDIMLGGNAEMLIEQLDQNLSSAQKETKLAEIKAQIFAEKEQVINVGGLFVIGTERHESRRIDNQLRGRSGRQGDPGTTKFFLSLEDDLMRIFASDRISGILRTLGLKDGEAIHHPMISRSLEKAQQKVEGHNYEIRKNLLRFDDVMNDQRKIIYEQRTDIIKSKNSHNFLMSTTEEFVKKVVLTFMPSGSYREDWDLDNLVIELHRVFALKFDSKIISDNNVTEEDVIKIVLKMANELYAEKEKEYSVDLMHNAVKYILLTNLDQVWKDHLHSLDHLRQGISLRAYAQKDPLSEYKREAYKLFEQMLDNLKELFIQTVYHFQIDLAHTQKEDILLENKKLQKNMHESREDPAFAKYNAGSSLEAELKPVVSRVNPEERVATDPSSWGRVARNESCPCGSGKKYKYCHGTNE